MDVNHRFNSDQGEPETVVTFGDDEFELFSRGLFERSMNGAISYRPGETESLFVMSGIFTHTAITRRIAEQRKLEMRTNGQTPRPVSDTDSL